jgi:hypothetical protein
MQRAVFLVLAQGKHHSSKHIFKIARQSILKGKALLENSRFLKAESINSFLLRRKE